MDPRNLRSVIDYRIFWLSLSEEEQEDWLHPDFISAFYPFWEHLVDRAREAAEKFAISYRGFKVGCAVLAYSHKIALATGVGVAGYKVFIGYNIKPQEGEGPNIHAEEIALFAAREEGYDTIIAITIVGETQADQQSGLITPNLHICGRCRLLLSSMPEVKNATIILLAHFNDGICEIMEFEELIIRHAMVQK